MKTSLQLIAVDDADYAGLIVWWRLYGKVSDEDMRSIVPPGLTRPELPSPSTALRRAAFSQQSKDLLVRPLKKGGFAFVRETTNADGILQHETESTVEIKYGYGGLAFNTISNGGESYEYKGVVKDEFYEKVDEDFNANLTSFDPMDISKWLVDVLEDLTGVPLRNRGGVYFIPADKTEIWLKLVKDLQSVSNHTFYSVPAMKTQEAVEAILDSLQRNAEQEISKVESELEHLGTRALTTRKNIIVNLEKNLSHYEALLGSSLPGLQTKLQSAKALIAQEILSKAEDV